MAVELITGALPANTDPTRSISFPGDIGVGLEFWQMLTDGIPAATYNKARGKPNPSWTGTPQNQTGYISLHGSVDFLTSQQIDPSGPSSMAIVARATGDQDPGPAPYDPAKVALQSFYMGSSDGNGGGQGIFVGTPGSAYGQARYLVPNGSGGTTAQTIPAQTNSTVANWRCLIFTADNTSVIMRDMTAGLKATTAVPAGSTRVSNGKPVKIGSADGALRQGYLDGQIAASASRAWSDVECQDVYRVFQNIASRKGIAI